MKYDVAGRSERASIEKAAERRWPNEKTLIVSLDLAGAALSGAGVLWVWVFLLGYELL